MAIIHEYDSQCCSLQPRLNRRLFTGAGFRNTYRNARRTLKQKRKENLKTCKHYRLLDDGRSSVGNKKKRGGGFTLLLVKRSSSPRSFLHETTCPPHRLTCKASQAIQPATAKSRQNNDQPINAEPIDRPTRRREERVASQSVPARRLPWASGARPGLRRSSP
jgi:hypothetical protein